MLLKFLLTFFLVFIFIVFAFGASVIRFIFRILLGGRDNNAAEKQSSREQQQKTNYKGTKQNSSKLISKDEGEYVDYEEVK